MIQKLKRLRFLWDDRYVYPWLLKQGRFRKLYSHLWSRFLVRDVAGGGLDWFWRRFPSLLGIPKEVEFEITTRCGLRCVMCEHTHWDHTKYAKQDISAVQLEQILKNWPSLRYVGIQGMGTPFLNKDFKQIVRLLDDRGIFINIVENFNDVSDDDLELIVKTVDRIDLSLDACSKELYEKIRPGSKFEKVINNISKCKELKLKYNSPFPSFFVRIVSFKENFHELPGIIDLVGSLDINNGGEVVIEISGLLVFEKIASLVDKTIQAPKEILDACNDAQKKYGAKIRLIFNRSQQNKKVDSCTKWVQPFVMANGDLVMDCGVMMSDDRLNLHAKTFGNVIDKSIKDIWNGEEYKRHRSAVNNLKAPVPETCSECRSYDSDHRKLVHGVMKINEAEVRQFQTEKTSGVVVMLNEPARYKKIYLKEFGKK